MKTTPVLLGDIADTCLGKMLDQKKNKGEYQPYLANVNVRWGGFDLDNLSQMRFLETEEERYGLEYGDILLCEGGEPGRCAIWKNQIPHMKFQKALHRIRVHKGKVDYRWLYYRLLYAGFRKEFDQYFSGTTTIKHMPGDKLVRIRLNLPELRVQEQIGDILSVYDDLIENNQKQIKLLEEAAQRLYKEWFVDLRFPGHEDVQIVDGVPEGWRKTPFSQKVDVMSGGTPKTSNPEYYNGSIPFYSPKDSSGAFFAFNTETHISQYGLDNCNSKLYPQGTVIITARGTVGKTTILAVPMAMNQSCYALKSDYFASVYYIFFALRQEIEALKTMANGGVFDTIIVKTFDRISILDPDKAIIEKFDQAVSPFMGEIKNDMRKITYLTEARDRLLPKLMSGEIEL